MNAKFEDTGTLLYAVKQDGLSVWQSTEKCWPCVLDEMLLRSISITKYPDETRKLSSQKQFEIPSGNFANQPMLASDPQKFQPKHF
jgi:hypothetical protein